MFLTPRKFCLFSAIDFVIRDLFSFVLQMIDRVLFAFVLHAVCSCHIEKPLTYIYLLPPERLQALYGVFSTPKTKTMSKRVILSFFVK